MTDIRDFFSDAAVARRQAWIRGHTGDPGADLLVKALRDEVPRAAAHPWEATKDLAGRAATEVAAMPGAIAKAYLRLPDDKPSVLDAESMGDTLVKAGAMSGERYPVLEATSQMLGPAAGPAALKGAKLVGKGIEKGAEAAGRAALPAALATRIALEGAVPDIAGVTRRAGQTSASIPRRGKPKLAPEVPPTGAPPETSMRQDIEKAVDDAAPDPTAPDPRDKGGPLYGFGEAKDAREANLKRRQGAQETQEVARQTGGGERGKLPGDHFRTMFDAQGAEGLAKALREEKNLTPLPNGGWLGYPGTVLTRRNLGSMRQSLDDQFKRAVDAVGYADFPRMGTWYDRTKAAQAEINEPFQLPRALERSGQYSAGVDPKSEYAFVTKHNNSRALGTGETPGRRPVAERLDLAEAENRPVKMGFKIGEYANKNDPRIVEWKPFGVNDFRMAQAFGHLDKEGNPWTKGLTPPMHRAMDAESALGVGRANENLIGGRGTWTGATWQELPWVLNKAEDIYGRGKNTRFAGGVEGMVKALREANDTMGDAFPKHAFSITSEATPARISGHAPEVHDLSFEERKQYKDAAPWATPSPEDPLKADYAPGSVPMPKEVGAGDRDAITRASLIHQQPKVESVGSYMGDNEPMDIYRPHVDFENLKTAPEPNTVNPHTMAALEANEMLRGVIGAQAHVAGHVPVTNPARGGRNSLLMERGTQPTVEELARLGEVLKGTGLDATATNRGVLLMNTLDPEVPMGPPRPGMKDIDPEKFKAKVKRDAQKAALKRSPQLAEAFPGAKPPEKAAFEGFYNEAISPAERAGQGEATQRVLDKYVKAPPVLARNVSESDEVRRIINQHIDRDVPFTGRPDIEQTRKFFRDKDWSKVVDMIRAGAKPAAAMAAVGASFEGMAAENPR
jgi:hypothetical protein